MENLSESPKLELENDALVQIKEIRKWTNFLSLMAFAFIGVMIVVMLSVFAYQMVNINHNNLRAFASFIPFILISGIYIFPIYYLFKFSKLSKQAIDNSDNISLSNALKYLKLHYRFMGILLILLFSFYVIMALIVVLKHYLHL